MKAINKEFIKRGVRRMPLTFVAAVLILITSGSSCNMADRALSILGNVESTLQQATESMDINSGRWISTVNGAVRDLSGVEKDLSQDLDSVVQRGVAAFDNAIKNDLGTATTMGMAYTDFLQNRIKRDIEQIIRRIQQKIAKIKRQPIPPDLPPPRPSIILLNPDSFPEGQAPTKIDVFGYDFEPSLVGTPKGVRLLMVQSQPVDISSMLHFSTHYKGIIALDESTRTRLRAKNTLRFEGTESGFKSEITVLDKPPPPPVAPKPPPKPYRLSCDNVIELPLFNPPKIGKGDNEFGTGDDVSCRVTLEARVIIRNATTLVASVRMRAEEWDRHSHKPHHDFTTADGWSQEFRIPILDAKPNTHLLSIVGDSYWTVPPFEMGTRPLNVSVGGVGLVKSYHVVGDTGTSQDIGVGENHTGVKFRLNKIQVNVVDN